VGERDQPSGVERQEERRLTRVRHRLRLDGVRPRELLAAWVGGLVSTPDRVRFLTAGLIALGAAGIYPPVLGPGSGPVQRLLTSEPDSLLMVAMAGLVLGAGVNLGAGALGDLTDRRRWMLIGLSGLAIASLWAFVDGDPPALGGAFVLATVSSGIVLPVALGRIRSAYDGEPGTQATAVAAGFAVLAIAQTVAPAMMDIVADMIGPPWAFPVPFAVAVLAIVLVVRWIGREPEVAAPSRAGVAVGIVLATCAIGLVSASILVVLGIGGLAAVIVFAVVVVAILGLQRWGSRTEQPMADMHVFPLRPIAAAVVAGMLLALGQAGPLMSFGIFLEAIQGYGSIPAGAALAPYAVAILVVGLVGPSLIPRFGVRSIVAVSLVGLALGNLLFAATSPSTSYVWYILPLFLLGGGMILGTAATSAVLTASTPNRLAASAIALQIASIEMGVLLGMTIQTVVLTTAASGAYETHLISIGLAGEAVASGVAALHEALLNVVPGIARQIPTTELESAVPGFRDAYAAGFDAAALVAAVICAAAAPICFVLFGPRSPEGVEAVLAAANMPSAAAPDGT
jgi:MFS family permease